MFTIDYKTWNYPCSIRRNAEIRSSEISGLMLDRTYFNDVLGTYFNYTVSIAVPLTDRDSYTDIYEMLTDPVEGHTFVFPYGQSSVTITGRVESVDDSYVQLSNDGQYWRNISFSVMANSPTKYKQSSDLITRGRLLVPEIAEHNEGDTWMWSNGQWVLTLSFRDADTTKY